MEPDLYRPTNRVFVPALPVAEPVMTHPQSQFRCQVCGYTANADVNGARNILAAGHAVLACGEMVQSGRSLKQEPTEMIQATA